MKVRTLSFSVSKPAVLAAINSSGVGAGGASTPPKLHLSKIGQNLKKIGQRSFDMLYSNITEVILPCY